VRPLPRLDKMEEALVTKIAAAFVISLLVAGTGATAQAAYSAPDKGSPALAAGPTQLALNPQPEPPNKNKKNKKPQKVKTNPNTPPPSGDRGPAPGQGY